MHACETKLPMQELMQGAYARGGVQLYYTIVKYLLVIPSSML